MKTLEDVLLEKEKIVALTERFGFASEVRIFCDEPSQSENEMSKLIFIVSSVKGKSIHFNSSNYLETLLRVILGCEVVDVRDIKAIQMFPGYTLDHSVSINELQNPDDLAGIFGKKSASQVFFDDTVKPNPIRLENALKHIASLGINWEEYTAKDEAKEPEEKKHRAVTSESDSPLGEKGTSTSKSPSPNRK